ncbi:FMN-binding negative transcriptional regulator [Streptomyces durmitorensis]|uniref:FMN-binding negative transcriptional regulator n=1 Tax=Streptomyces durmitorensis TaxID=319947 RepID=A0ABY4Q3G5_9ACTN|nr:FMN-binding negative transcriptional regulator [Streptomyces durmitorensis]UQT59914.1 FMN-binding negative transcriptional regulator [Streptomyces durmitorensis]
MLIHPWDAPRSDAEWQQWLAGHDFGQLAVNGLPGEPPHVQPAHFAYEADHGPRGRVITHLARPNPLWPALEADPDVLLSVVDDYAYVPGPWKAPAGTPAEHGVPTSLYAAVQLRCTARVVDSPREKAELLNRQVAHFQPEGGTAPAEVGEDPFGRLLSGIRVLCLEVTGVQAKFKYAGDKPQDVQDRIASGLAERGGPRDAAAQAQQLRRR